MEAGGDSPTTEAGRTRRGRPRDPAVDQAILAAAVALLGEVGYARLTMEQVAERAGVGKASLYLRWSNKVALVAEALQQRSGAVPEVADTGSLREDMLLFLRSLLRSRRAAAQALSAVSGEVASNPELRAAWHRGLAGALAGCVRTIVERAVARGELPATSDVELLSVLPLAVLQHLALEHDRRPDDAVVARIVDQFYTPRTASAPADLARGNDDRGHRAEEDTRDQRR
jgi:AcrR family transcriptional regulator